MELPKRDKNHSLESKAEAAFDKLIADSGCFLVQRSDRKDYGTDYQIEVVRDDMATNARLHVQLKGTGKTPNADGSISVAVEMANLNYLRMQAYSFYVCYHEPTESLKFRSAEAVTRQYQRSENDWMQQNTVTVNFIEPLTLSVLERLVVVRLDARNRQRHDDDGSRSAGRGQFRWRSWSVAEGLVARWLAFGTLPTALHRWLCNERWPLYGFPHTACALNHRLATPNPGTV